MVEGITVPVLDMELAELESSSRRIESSSRSSRRGSGGGSEESFVLARVLARSDSGGGSEESFVFAKLLARSDMAGVRQCHFGVPVQGCGSDVPMWRRGLGRGMQLIDCKDELPAQQSLQS